jgi:DNA polymerase (family X)
MKNLQIAEIFSEIADLLELQGDNPFRIRAYRRAARTVEGAPKDLSTLSPEELRALPGIGEDLAGKIRQYADTGRVELHERLRREVPEGLLQILRIPGIGPKTARRLHDAANVRDVEELEALARSHKLLALPGIREKTEENILKGIDALRKGRDRLPLGRVLPIAREIVEFLRGAAPVGEIAVAGSLRRMKDTIRDIDVLAAGGDPAEVVRCFAEMPFAREVLEQGTTKASAVTGEGIQVDLRVVEADSFGAALCYFTGSKGHNIRLREMAAGRGLKINEYGVFRERDGRKIGGRQEEDVYAALGLPFIPPELREDMGEIEAALEGKLPSLVTLGDIRGDLHAHTNWSDGSHELEDLVLAAKGRKYRYLAITDHSKGLGVAHGLDAGRLRAQLDRIDAVNRELKGFRILKGIEVDVRGDGGLDLPDDLLKQLDIVVASIHSGFRQPREQITRRLVSAVRNPCVSVIAHPTGRLIGARDAYDVDLEEVLREAGRHGKAMEINGHPQRLDLSDVHVKRAKEHGVPLVVSTDAHAAGDFGYMEYGVAVARRGWLSRADVLNTLAPGSLLRKLRAMREGVAGHEQGR